MKVKITPLDSDGMEWSYREADGSLRFLDFRTMTYKLGNVVSPIDPDFRSHAMYISKKEEIVAAVIAARDKWLASQRAKDVPPPTIRRIDDEGNLWGYREQSWSTGEVRLDFGQSIYINTDGRRWDFGHMGSHSFCQKVLHKVTIERDKWLTAQEAKSEVQQRDALWVHAMYLGVQEELAKQLSLRNQDGSTKCGWSHGPVDAPEPEPTCQDELIPDYVEETWVARSPVELAPNWQEDLAGIQNAEARLRASITRNERWPFCPTCQQNRRLAYDYEESETNHRLITKVTAFWTCTKEGEEDE